MGCLANASERVGAALDVLDDVAQRVLEDARLALALEDLEAPQDRQAGVLEGRELAGEGAELLGRDLADGERLLLAASPLLGRRLRLAPSALGPLGDLGDEEPLLADQLLRLLLRRGVDRVLDLPPVWSIASYW